MGGWTVHHDLRTPPCLPYLLFDKQCRVVGSIDDQEFNEGAELRSIYQSSAAYVVAGRGRGMVCQQGIVDLPSMVSCGMVHVLVQYREGYRRRRSRSRASVGVAGIVETGRDYDTVYLFWQCRLSR